MIVNIVALLVLLLPSSWGSANSPRILGGADAAIADFPFAASIERADTGHYCGASVVAAAWVLTDAWCAQLPLNLTEWTVRAGSATLGNGSLHGVTQWIPHRLADPINGDYDFALLNVDPPFDLGDNLAAVAFTAQDQETPDGADAVVAGWGEVDGVDKETVSQLQYANITTLSDAACADTLGFDYNDRMLCAQDANATVAVCWRDEGGPLVIDGVLFGVALWRGNCGVPGRVQVFSRVAKVSTWITAVTAE